MRAAAAAGVIGTGAAEILVPAARLYQALTQVLRLSLDGPFKAETAPTGVRDLLTRAGDAPDFARLEADLAETQARVRATFEEVVGKMAETAGAI